jgi:hypothetical protein
MRLSIGPGALSAGVRHHPISAPPAGHFEMASDFGTHPYLVVIARCLSDRMVYWSYRFEWDRPMACGRSAVRVRIGVPSARLPVLGSQVLTQRYPVLIRIVVLRGNSKPPFSLKKRGRELASSRRQSILTWFFDNRDCACSSLSLPALSQSCFGGDLVSTGIVRGCLRAGAVWIPVIKPGKPLNGEFNYAMAA